MALSNDQDATLYGHIGNELATSPVNFPIFLLSEESFQERSQHVIRILIGFYAIMFALLFYNLCLFISLRERAYGYYNLFLITATLTCSSIDGTAVEWFFTDSPTLNLRILQILGCVSAIVYTNFLFNLLNGIPFWPRYKTFYKRLMLVSGVLTFYCAITPFTKHAAVIVTVFSIGLLTLNLVIILAATKHKMPSAGYLLLAESVMFVGVFSFMFLLHGLVGLTRFYYWALHWGFLSEVLLLSLALAEKTRIAQLEAMDQRQQAFIAYFCKRGRSILRSVGTPTLRLQTLCFYLKCPR